MNRGESTFFLCDLYDINFKLIKKDLYTICSNILMILQVLTTIYGILIKNWGCEKMIVKDVNRQMI